MSNSKNEIPIEWFCCPTTKEQLSFKGGDLYSKKRVYRKDNKYNYWIFLPQGSTFLNTPMGKTWQILQTNGEVSYNLSPHENLGVGKRSDFFDFAEFCNFHGNVLDVGVGPQQVPTHIEYCQKKDIFFVGIDPLKGEQPRFYPFVLGLAEFLPFNNGVFDQVLYVTSFDHFIDPDLAIIEAKRVLKDTGELCIWFGEKDKDAPRNKKSHEWYENLNIPKGADDKFHLRRITKAIFLDYVNAHHLGIYDSHVQSIDQFRRNYFYKLVIGK